MYQRRTKKLSRRGSANAGIRTPHEHDVLCGRGAGAKNHEGNIIYRQMVESNRNIYKASSDKRKRCLARSIVEAVHNAQTPPGRFLEKKKDGLWYKLRYEAAVEKTKQSLRETRGCQSLKRKRVAISASKSDSQQGEKDSRKRQKSEGSHCTIVNDEIEPLPIEKKPTTMLGNDQGRKNVQPATTQSGCITQEDNASVDHMYSTVKLSPQLCPVKPQVKHEEVTPPIPKNSSFNIAEYPTLARATTTLGTLLKKGSFFPLIPFDDETEMQILNEYGISSMLAEGERTTKQKLNDPPALKIQTTTGLTMGKTELFSQKTNMLSASFNQRRKKEDQRSRKSLRVRPSSLRLQQRLSLLVGLSAEESELLRQITTASLSTLCQEGKPDSASKKQLPHWDAPSLEATDSTTTLTAEETQLLSQISFCQWEPNESQGNSKKISRARRSLRLSLDSSLLTGLTPEETELLSRITTISLSTLCQGKPDSTGKKQSPCHDQPSLSAQAARSLAPEETPWPLSGIMDGVSSADINVPSMTVALAVSSGSLVDVDDFDSTKEARLRRMPCGWNAA